MKAHLIGIARRSRPRADSETLRQAHISEDLGLEGDFRGQNRQRQVTVLFAEDWQNALKELGRELPWTTRRANLLVAGLKEKTSAKTVGARLRIGGVTLEVTEETKPCSRMEEQAPGLRAALSPDWRGGICCTVVTGGLVALDDAVEVLDPAQIERMHSNAVKTGTGPR